jgi:hypothetical protein
MYGETRVDESHGLFGRTVHQSQFIFKCELQQTTLSPCDFAVLDLFTGDTQ